jgi:signal transduction histidine kinase
MATDKAGSINEWRILADGFRTLHQIATIRSDHQAALQYYMQFIQYRDTLMNLEKEQALHQAELDHALEKGQDSLRIINAMQEKQLTQQQENSRLQLRQTIYGWIISVLVLGVATGILLFRKRIQHMRMKHLLALKENQAALKESAYQSQMNDLMLSGIKSQMNPHFLFNCLTSITLYIEEKNLEAASRYLSLFSQLIRYTLDASSQVHLLLSRELEMLKLYLELESMRFKQKMTYSIDIDPELDPELMYLPHMMVQPLVENAIWHGLMHKPDGGHIQIAFSRLDDKRLQVTVEDDGIGRMQSAQLKSQKHDFRQSMGTKLLQDRISLMNRQSDISCSFNTEDLSDSQGHPCGTRITLIIPVA